LLLSRSAAYRYRSSSSPHLVRLTTSMFHHAAHHSETYGTLATVVHFLAIPVLLAIYVTTNQRQQACAWRKCPLVIKPKPCRHVDWSVSFTRLIVDRIAIRRALPLQAQASNKVRCSRWILANGSKGADVLSIRPAQASSCQWNRAVCILPRHYQRGDCSPELRMQIALNRMMILGLA
jgi:hypothetical protein